VDKIAFDVFQKKVSIFCKIDKSSLNIEQYHGLPDLTLDALWVV